MKRILLTLLLGAIALTANAQVYLGGSISFLGAKENSAFAFSPEIGYQFHGDMAIGTTMSVGLSGGITQLSISPYFRYYFLNLGPARMFADAMFEFDYLKYQDQSGTTWGVGLCPGIAFPLSDHFSIVTRFLTIAYMDDVFAVSFNNNCSLGVFYSF